eukprot:COSAG01_NODE_53_length_31352_cov_23.122452_19_plen_116_part_00
MYFFGIMHDLAMSGMLSCAILCGNRMKTPANLRILGGTLVIICCIIITEMLQWVAPWPITRSARLRWLSVPPFVGSPTNALSSQINNFRPFFSSKNESGGHSVSGVVSNSDHSPF